MRMKLVTAFATMAAFAGLTNVAQAEGTSVEVGTGFSTLLIDRGESLATTNNEFSLTVTQDTTIGGVYGGLYRIHRLAVRPARSTKRWTTLLELAAQRAASHMILARII